MNKIVIGKYVNTHGIKGEIRIKSTFTYKNRLFKIGNEIIINDKEYIISSYRVHKDYDMITIKGINSINDIPFIKNSLVYIDRDKYLNKDEYLDRDLINFMVCVNNHEFGKVSEISYITETKKLLVVNKHFIPFELIDKVDLANKQIIVKEVEGLLDEN